MQTLPYINAWIELKLCQPPGNILGWKLSNADSKVCMWMQEPKKPGQLAPGGAPWPLPSPGVHRRGLLGLTELLTVKFYSSERLVQKLQKNVPFPQPPSVSSWMCPCLQMRTMEMRVPCLRPGMPIPALVSSGLTPTQAGTGDQIKHRYSVFAPGSWHTAPITLAVSGMTECLLYANGIPGDGVGVGEALDRLRVGAGPQKDQESIRGLDFSAQISGTQGRGGGWRWNSIPNGGWFDQSSPCNVTSIKPLNDKVQKAPGVLGGWCPQSVEAPPSIPTPALFLSSIWMNLSRTLDNYWW